MEKQYFSLERIPDFTMAKYSEQESQSVNDVIEQHSSFYRQLNRRGLLFSEYYSLIYTYDPALPAGSRLRLLFSAVNENQPIQLMEQFIGSASLTSSFALKPVNSPSADEKYTCCAYLTKKSTWINSSLAENQSRYFAVDPWKANKNGRLMALFRLMKELNTRCAYAVTIFPTEQSDSYRDIMSHQERWMKAGTTGGFGISQRDDNAEKCRRIYSDTVDKLRTQPHFHCQVAAYADSSSIARLLVDSAASEAVSEGNYNIPCYQNGTFSPFSDNNWIIPKEKDAPAGLEYWPVLFLLDELVHFAALPTLYPGESIELPKETAPIYEKDGLFLGLDNVGYKVYMPLRNLSKHAFIAGVPGSGKTYSMLHIASQLTSKENRIPVLIFEPAKQEYRALAKNPDITDLMVFSPGGSGCFPLRINPFEFPENMRLSEHIVNLRQVFIGAFDLESPMPFLLDQGIENVYRKKGWYPFERNLFDGHGRSIKPYPNMKMLFDEVGRLLEAMDYADEVKKNLKTVLQVRIGSLVTRETGNVFNVDRSTLRPEEWMQHSCVIELESLGKDGANFTTLLLTTLIREYIKLHPSSEMSPRHVIFFEEAHNLIGPTTEAAEHKGGAKVASTKFIVEMLAEVRALMEAIIIADQLPTALAPQITKNTSLKLGHRMTAQDEREMLASTMSADGVQMEKMALFGPGHALCIYEDVLKPFELQMAKYAADSKSPNDEELFALLKDQPTYRECMARDYDIMRERFASLRKDIDKQTEDIYTALDDWNMNMREYEQSLKVRPAADTAKLKKVLDSQIKLLKSDANSLLDKYIELALEALDYAEINRLKKTTVKKEIVAPSMDNFMHFVSSMKETGLIDALDPRKKKAMQSASRDIENLAF